MLSNEEKEEVYNIPSLKEQFRQLKNMNDFILTPLLACFFYRWIDNLPDELITDIRKESRERNEAFYCAVEGKIVKIDVQGRDIDVEDADESWFMAENIYFKGREEQVNKIFGRFKGFVGRSNLEAMIYFSREELAKGKTHHLSSEMLNFYFGRGKK